MGTGGIERKKDTLTVASRARTSQLHIGAENLAHFMPHTAPSLTFLVLK
jgi:hypothetical protein